MSHGEIVDGPTFLPRKRAAPLIVFEALLRVVTRRVAVPVCAPIPHSAGPQRTVFVFAGVEVLTAVVIASVIPPAWSLPHLLLEVIALGTYVGLGLVWRTTPHELRDDALVIRTGVLGDLVVPLTAVATVRPEPRTSAGFGTRFVDDSTIACSVTSDTNVTITLESAHGFTLKKGGTRQVKHIRLNAEDPRRAAREISAQGSGRACDSGAA